MKNRKKDPMQENRKNFCGAKTRQGTPCKNHGMANGRCRMHGGKSTGPKTEAGKLRCKTARLKHGHETKEAREEKKALSELSSVMTKHLYDFTVEGGIEVLVALGKLDKAQLRSMKVENMVKVRRLAEQMAEK